MQWIRRMSWSLAWTGMLLSSVAPASPSQLVRWTTVAWSAGRATAATGEGERVELGLDGDLQRALEQALAGAHAIAAGAVLVDVATGQVLAAGETGVSRSSLLLDAIAPAASVFKLVTTAALYERTPVTPRTVVCTAGGVREITAEHLRPASGPEATCAAFGQALGVSRNAAYAQLATTALLRSDLVDVSENLGFGSDLALDVRGQVGSLEVPYNDLDFARTATGFENSRLSVFGGAQLALTIASGGLLRPMHLSRNAEAQPTEERVLSVETARRLRRAMEITVHSGTAREAFVDDLGHSLLGPIQAAGKTGTLCPEPGAPTASWFVGFAPSDRPTVVVSVLLQNPERWYRKGHQVARDLLAVYFRRRGVQGIKSP
jgi:peptidoglycan glycosyltransferase